MDRVSKRLVEGSSLVPFLTVGATDARFFRREGSVAYGYGLFSRKLSFDDYASMFHGNDERVDIESLVLSTRALGRPRPRPARLSRRCRLLVALLAEVALEVLGERFARREVVFVEPVFVVVVDVAVIVVGRRASVASSAVSS